jgi:hypothetical protein
MEASGLQTISYLLAWVTQWYMESDRKHCICLEKGDSEVLRSSPGHSSQGLDKLPAAWAGDILLHFVSIG